MTGPLKRMAWGTVVLAVLLSLPWGCGPPGDDISEFQGVWINTTVLKGRPIVVRFDGRHIRITIGTFFKLYLKLIRAKRTGRTFTLTIKDPEGHQADHQVVKIGPDRLRTVIEGQGYVFRRLPPAEAAKYKMP